MKPLRRIASPVFLMVIATAVLLGGCGESTTSPPSPVTHEAVKLSPEQELAALTKKAEQGDASAQFSLGAMYLDGDGVRKDAIKAEEWWQKAAAQGNASAQTNLGVMYLNGDGVPKDAIKAVEWFQKAAAQGIAAAQFNLGAMYDNGDGVPKDAAKAVEWYQKAAEQGNVGAQVFLGSMYYYGEGLSKNLAKATEWYLKAAKQGNAEAQFILGSMYENGMGVPKDPATAIEWYRRAAEQGDTKSQFNLGRIYDNGNGVPKNSSEAAGWYRKAAEQGDTKAQFVLGIAYKEGFGVPKDLVLAYAWLNIMAVSNSEVGKTFRSSIEPKLSGNQLAEAQRLSSNWKKGQALVREGKPDTTSTGATSTPDTLSKKGTGTLFVVSKTGHAITNQHVASGCAEIRIQGREGIAKLVTEDSVNDLALVKIQGAVSDIAAIAAEPNKLRQGEDIVAYGFPLNAVLSSGGNLTPGVVSALTGLGNNTNQIQITAPVQPGSSGSPVLNKKGEVVGVVSMKLDDKKMVSATGQIGQNINFAVSGLTLKTFLDTHKVDYRSGGMFSLVSKSTADIADEARKWTLVVECWK